MFKTQTKVYSSRPLRQDALSERVLRVAIFQMPLTDVAFNAYFEMFSKKFVA